MMTLTLTLPEKLEKRLTEEAAQQGYSATVYAQRILEERLQQKTKSAQAVALLQSWIDEGDPDEQQKTGNYLVQSLDADRMSDRQLFPSETEGVTW